jgi:hypothetical protein
MIRFYNHIHIRTSDHNDLSRFHKQVLFWFNRVIKSNRRQYEKPNLLFAKMGILKKDLMRIDDHKWLKVKSKNLKNKVSFMEVAAKIRLIVFAYDQWYVFIFL